MIELITIIILLGSLIGMGVILYRKIPDLRKLEDFKKEQISNKSILNPELEIEHWRFFKPDFSLDSTQHKFETFLQKLLSRIKVLTMKIENRISGHLQKLRERAQQRERAGEDEYWQKLRKSIGFKRREKK